MTDHTADAELAVTATLTAAAQARGNTLTVTATGVATGQRNQGSHSAATVTATGTAAAGITPGATSSLAVTAATTGVAGIGVSAEAALEITATSDGTVATDDEWVVVEGTHEVPATINGVVPARATLMLQVSDEVTEGQVWFTQSRLSKAQLIRQTLVANLPEDKAAIIDAAAGSTGASTTDIEDRLAGISAGTGNVDWDYVPDLHTLNDNVVKQLNNWSGTEYGHAESAAALSAQRTSVLNANSTVSTLQVQLAVLQATVESSGKGAVLDNFQRTSTTDLGTDWTQSYSGSSTSLLATADGQNAKWSSVNGARYCLAVHDTASSSDYQIVKQVLSSSPQTFGATNFTSNDLLGRVGSGFSEYVRFRITGEYAWSLYYFASGVGYSIASGTVASLPTTMTLICGDADTATPRAFQVFADATLLWSGTDSSSSYGASYRGMGFASSVIEDAGSYRYPGMVDVWTGRDA